MFLPDIIVDYILAPEIAMSNVFRNIINPLRLVLGSLWIMSLHVIAVQKVQKLFLGKSIVVTLLAYIPYMFLVLTYIH